MTQPITLKPQATHNILIAGGNLVGLTTAIALARHGIPITVIDPAPMQSKTIPTFDGRALAISLSSSHLFKNIGVWEHLVEHASPIHDIRVADGHPLRGLSPFFVHYDHQTLGHEPFGYIIEHRYLIEALQKVVLSLPNIHFIQGRLTAFETHNTHVEAHYKTAEQQDTINATLLIAADGKFSHARHIAGITTTTIPYKQKALVCTVEHERDHQGTAVELFLPNGPFAMLPMTDNRSNIVWSDHPDIVDFLLGADEETFTQELHKRFGEWLGDYKVVGPRFSYPLSLSLATQYTQERFILIGDAAHSIHPIAGQGFNLGIRDIAALEDIIAPLYKNGLDFGHKMYLKEYEKWRHLDNQTLALVCHSLLTLFSNDQSIIRTIRNVGFMLVQHTPPLKKIFMKHAMGTLGKLPQLLKLPR